MESGSAQRAARRRSNIGNWTAREWKLGRGEWKEERRKTVYNRIGTLLLRTRDYLARFSSCWRLSYKVGVFMKTPASWGHKHFRNSDENTSWRFRHFYRAELVLSLRQEWWLFAKAPTLSYKNVKYTPVGGLMKTPAGAFGKMQTL